MVITFFINSFSVWAHWIYVFVFASVPQTKRSWKFTPCSRPSEVAQFLEAIFLAFHDFWHIRKSKWKRTGHCVLNVQHGLHLHRDSHLKKKSLRTNISKKHRRVKVASVCTERLYQSMHFSSLVPSMLRGLSDSVSSVTTQKFAVRTRQRFLGGQMPAVHPARELWVNLVLSLCYICISPRAQGDPPMDRTDAAANICHLGGLHLQYVLHLRRSFGLFQN